VFDLRNRINFIREKKWADIANDWRAKNNVVLGSGTMILYMRSIFQVALGNIAECVEASAGDEVLSLYKKHNPDVVFMDLHLPVKNGQEAMMEILDYDESAFIIMMSADAVAMVVQKATNAAAKVLSSNPL